MFVRRFLTFFLIFKTSIVYAVCDKGLYSESSFNDLILDDHKKIIGKYRNNCALLGEFSEDFESSTYWAQQMTGADLVRKEILKNRAPIKISSDDVVIWDVGEPHAELVSNLIAGPNISALIPNHLSPPHVHFLAGNPEVVGNQAQHCLKKSGSCPRFINHSDGWKGTHDDGIGTGQIYSKLNSKGVISVIAAGNDTGSVEKAKDKFGKDILLVGASSKTGQPKSWSSQSRFVVVTAPGDRLMSFNFKNEELDFGATSAATPQVTSALLMFEKISGLQINLEQAKRLLMKTALPFTNKREDEQHGAGILNSYKLFELAKKLKNNCDGRGQGCRIDSIYSDEFYYLEAKIDIELFEDVQKFFPECNENTNKENSIESELNCNAQRRIFEKVRQVSLLNHSDKKAWDLLTCMTSLSPYKENHQYYKAMSSKNEIPSLEVVEKIDLNKSSLSFEDYRASIENLLLKDNLDLEMIMNLARKSSDKLPKSHIELVKMAMKFDINWDELSALRLEDQIYKKDPTVLDQFIERENEDIYEYLAYKVLGQSHWNDDQFEKWAIRILNKSKEKIVDHDLFLNGYMIRKKKSQKLLDRLFAEGNIDGLLARSLPEQYWKKNPEKLDLLIHRGASNGDIIRNILPLLSKEMRLDIIRKLKPNLDSVEAIELKRFNEYSGNLLNSN